MLLRNGRIYLIISVIAFSTVTMVKVPYAFSGSRNFIPPRVVIDGKPVSPELFAAQLKMNFLAYVSTHGNKDFENYARQHSMEVVQPMIDRELLVREAVKNSMSVDETEFNLKFESRIDGLGGKDKVAAFYASAGLTIDQHRSLSRHAYLAGKYLEKYVTLAEVTDREAKIYYNENVDTISGVETVHYSYVGIRALDEKLEPEIIQEMKNAKNRITNREDLIRLASRLKVRFREGAIVVKILDNKTDSKKRNVMYEKGRALKVGQTAFFRHEKPNGEVYYLILFLDKFEPRKGPGFEEMKEMVKKRITLERMNRAVKAKLTELRGRSVIKVLQ
ncbi:MAG: hypothetical protein ACC669_05275 [bacterium]